MDKFIVLRPVFKNEEFSHWADVGPASSVDDAKRRYAPVQYGYAVVLRKA